jgi:hypothetical protein
LPSRRQQAGSFDSGCAETSGVTSPKPIATNSRSA